MITRHVVTTYTNSGGAATSYTAVPVDGLVHAIVYQPGDLDTGGDVTVTGEVSGVAVLTLLNLGTSGITIMPRAAVTAVSNTANAAANYAATFPVMDRVPVAGERLKFVVAQGGDSKTGTFHVYVAT